MGFRLVTDNTYELISVQIFWVSLLGIWLIYGLFAFWICSRKINWFVRFSCLAASAALLLGIEAPALMIAVLSYGLTIWAAHIVSKSNTFRRVMRRKGNGVADQRSATTSLQIGLADGLLGVCAFAILLVLARVELTPPFSLLYSVTFGVALGAGAIFACWLAQVKTRWALAFGIIASILGAFAIHWVIFLAPRDNGLFAAIVGASFIWSNLSNFVIAILICNVIAIYLLSILSNWKSQTNSRYRFVARLLWGLSVVAIVVLSIGTIDVYRRLLRTYEIAWYVPSSENEINGYDELVSVSDRIEESAILSDPDAAPVGAKLARELKIYAAEFQLIESAMQRPVQTAALENIDEYDALLDTSQNMRAIARALVCRAKQHFHVGDADKAIRDSCRVIELRIPLSRAKTLVCELIANAIEGIGVFSTLDYINVASSSALRGSIERLIAVENARQDFQEIYQNDVATWWERQNWVGHLFIICDEKDSRRNFDTQLTNTFNACLARRRQMITLMALELFRREHNGYPISLSTLSPKYLPAVPQDPFAIDQSLSYRLSESKDTFQLYSIGPDQRDDGGKLGFEGFPYGDGDLNVVAEIQYEKATTTAERQSLTLPDPWEEDYQELTPEEKQILEVD